jgi:hypothetical protein
VAAAGCSDGDQVDAQSAHAVIDAALPDVPSRVTTTPCALHRKPVPLAVGDEYAVAALIIVPCETSAPPPTSTFPDGQAA